MLHMRGCLESVEWNGGMDWEKSLRFHVIYSIIWIGLIGTKCITEAYQHISERGAEAEGRLTGRGQPPRC